MFISDVVGHFKTGAYADSSSHLTNSSFWHFTVMEDATF